MEKSRRRVAFALVAAIVLATAFVMVPRTALAATVTETSNATIAFDGGNLLLVEAPTISFGLHTIESDVENFTANTVTPNLEVSDARGTGLGWKVTAELSSFQISGSNTLPGAVLTMTAASATGTGTAPSPASTIALDAGGAAATIETAAAGTGLGVWDTSWLPVNASLYVPIASQSTGGHQATLTWTLADTPA